MKCTKYKNPADILQGHDFNGAEGRTRTGTVVGPLDFESSASANSATSATVYVAVLTSNNKYILAYRNISVNKNFYFFYIQHGRR